MEIIQYTNQMSAEWDDFVRTSKNGTFLLERQFMDYHSNRFDDCSLMLRDNSELLAVFPANFDSASGIVYSHEGLTYGGIILHPEATISQVMEMVHDICLWFMDYLQARRLVYKPIPYIYSDGASEEDLYALFRAGAHLKNRGLSTVVTMDNPLRMRKLRLRGARKAIDNGLYTDRMGDGDWEVLRSYWALLTDVLQTYHSVNPVHTFEEIQLLMSRFPQQIKLFLVRREGEILAGCVVFVMRYVAHIQYIAANDEGKELGALDLLFRHLITERYRQMRYLDFGISTEQGGRVLNEGLVFQKEGFGGRGVCYDTYELELNRDTIEALVPAPAEQISTIRFLDLKCINASFEPQLTDAVTQVIGSGRYLQGSHVADFEKAFARYVGVEHCVLCGNGLEALTLILRSLAHLRGWTAENEVLVPANTFIATILAIREAGLRPVLCEPNINDYLLDAKTLEQYLTPHTVAVLPVHIYGCICDMTSINAFAAAHELVVVEDAAQAHGAMLGDCKAGALGHAAGFSFYPGKNLGALGDAGCVTTSDAELAQLVRMMGNYGSREKYVNEVAGINSRTDEIQAAVLSTKLPRLDADNALRRSIAERYSAGIDNPLIMLPQMPKEATSHVFYTYVIRTSYRNELQTWLRNCGIETLIHYPIAPHKQQALAADFGHLKLPITEQIHREVLSLPISPLLTENDVARVIDAVNQFNVK